MCLDWDRPADMCRHIYHNKEKASTNITLGWLMAYNSESIMGPFPNCRGHSLLTPWAGVWINLVCEYFLWEEEERQTRGRKPEWGLLAAFVDSQIKEKLLCMSTEVKWTPVPAVQGWRDASLSLVGRTGRHHNTGATNKGALGLKGH